MQSKGFYKLSTYIYIINLLKKKIAKIQAQLEVEMAKNSKVSDGTLLIPTGKKKP